MLTQALLMLTLTACQASESDSEKTTAIESSSQNTIDNATLCEHNLLQNPQFDKGENDVFPSPWGDSQHAGDRIYSVDISDGELTIKKNGEQHWMLISQRIDAKTVAGHSLVFSTELKQNMNDDGWTQALEAGGGLSIVIHGTVPDSPFSQKILLSSNLQHEPKLGVFDWTPVQVAFDVPDTVTAMTVGFLHQAYGEMSVRNPALRIKPVDADECTQDL